jgi:hypothetical protein
VASSTNPGAIVSKFDQIPDEQLGLLRLFKDGNPFDRKIVKRPGMTYGYGSRQGGWQKTKGGGYRPKGMTEQIVEVLKDRDQSPKDAHKLAKAVYNVIEELMPAAKQLRNFLEAVAKVYAEYNKTMRWDTALKLPVVNAYYEPIPPQRFSVKIDGKRRRANLIMGDTDDVGTKAITSVTANFVHSSDACHLHMVGNAIAKEAIPSVTTTTAMDLLRHMRSAVTKSCASNSLNCMRGITGLSRYYSQQSAIFLNLPTPSCRSYPSAEICI